MKISIEFHYIPWTVEDLDSYIIFLYTLFSCSLVGLVFGVADLLKQRRHKIKRPRPAPKFVHDSEWLANH